MAYKVCWKDKQGDLQEATELIEDMYEALDCCRFLLCLYGYYHWVEEV